MVINEPARQVPLYGEYEVVVVGSDGKSVFLSGTRQPGAKWNTEAPRPWVDKLDFESGQRSRVFDSPADAYETFVAALDDDYSSYIYTHESPTVIRDAFLKDAIAWFAEGHLRYKEDIVEGLHNAAEHFCRLMRGENFGKALVKA